MCAVSTLNGLKNDDAQAYHHGNLREALLINGLALLESTQGTEFSLRELSRVVGVSANAAYRHFANKEELLTAMAIHGFQQMVARQAEQVQSASNAGNGFLSAGRAYVDFARQNPALFRLMFGRFAATQRNEELSAAAQLAYQGMRYSAAAALDKSPDDAEMTVVAMQAWSLVHGLSHLIIDGQFDAHTDNIDQMIDAVFQQAASHSPHIAAESSPHRQDG